MPTWITVRLRIPTHIPVRVLARSVPLFDIRREEHSCHLIIITGIVVIQPGQAVVVLPGEAFGGVDGTLKITRVAVGTIHLVAFDGGAACHVVETGQHAAQRIGQVEGGLAVVVARAQ